MGLGTPLVVIPEVQWAWVPERVGTGRAKPPAWRYNGREGWRGGEAHLVKPLSRRAGERVAVGSHRAAAREQGDPPVLADSS